jgi:hypothetical protein
VSIILRVVLLLTQVLEGGLLCWVQGTREGGGHMATVNHTMMSWMEPVLQQYACAGSPDKRCSSSRLQVCVSTMWHSVVQPQEHDARVDTRASGSKGFVHAS